MSKSRLTVTIPEEDYKRIEQEKEKKNINRSALIQEIIEFFFEKKDKQVKINKYIDGYKRIKEKTRYIEHLEKIQTEALDGEF